MIFAIYLIFIIFIIAYSLTVAKQQQNNKKPPIRTVRKPHVNTYSKHNSQASFKRNNEKDVVKDKPLSEAERNVLYGK